MVVAAVDKISAALTVTAGDEVWYTMNKDLDVDGGAYETFLDTGDSASGLTAAEDALQIVAAADVDMTIILNGNAVDDVPTGAVTGTSR